MNADLKRVIAKIEKNEKIKSYQKQRVISKFFNKLPVGVDIGLTKYSFGKKRILDVGSGYGVSALFWGKNSEAIEIQPEMALWLRRLGLKVHRINVEDSLDKLKPQSFDGVFCNNLIEHLVAPHYFLINLHRVLKPRGILILGHPVTPPDGWEWVWEKSLGYKSWLSIEHINFFTPKTIKLTLERSGFKVEEQINPGIYNKPWIKPLSKFINFVGADIVTVARKRPLNYQAKRWIEFEPGWAKTMKEYHRG